MTSLQKQLERLKTPASSALSIEKEHVSLLFDRKDAATLDREAIYKIGLTGMSQLSKLDENFSQYESELFDETKLNFNRAMIGKEENEKLDQSLQRMITYLTPYFNHQACKQVLEWLIYKYQIHRYNADFLATAFLLYHSTNSYGRLLQILNLTKPEWSWTTEFSKSGIPIPFNVLIKQIFSGGGNYYLVGNFSNFLSDAIKLVGQEYSEKHLQSQFTFYASLLASLFEDASKINDQLIARVIPSIATALNSKILPFKYAGMMAICQMVSTTSLSDDILMPILKLILLKMKSVWLEIAMNTVIVICQRQSLSELPTKAMKKLILRSEELNLKPFLTESMKFYDLTDFLIPFWNTIFTILREGLKEDEFEIFDSMVVSSLNLDVLNEKQAAGFLRALFQFLDEPNKNLWSLAKTAKHVRPVVLRYPSTFETIQAEWKVRNGALASKFLSEFNLESYEVTGIELDSKEMKRKRKLSISQTKESDSKMIENVTKKKQLSNLKEFAAKKPYKGSLIDVFELIQDIKKHEKALFAMESAASPDYLKKQPIQEIDEFIVKSVHLASKTSTFPLLKNLRILLSQLNWDLKVMLLLLTPYSSAPDPKRNKQVRSTVSSSLFEKETEEEFSRRLTFVLEILNVNKQVKCSHELLAKLFDLVDNAIVEKCEAINNIYVQQLTISLIDRFLSNTESASWLEKNSARLDSLVKVIRFTHDHAVLRNALRIFASVAPLLTKPVVTQLMSVFAFMGDGGLLKKDNELTLSIIEETLSSLFSAVMKSENNNDSTHKKLLEISRTFGGSLIDLPAHRRIRVLHAFVKTIKKEDIWVLLSTIFDEFCLKWQKTDSKKQDIEVLDDISLELISEFDSEYQIETILNLLDYVVSLRGDSNKSTKFTTSFYTDVVIFDRNRRSLQKLRHFRFIIFGWAIKFLSHRPLYEKLATLTDAEIYSKFLNAGKRLVISVANLCDFVDAELNEAERNEQKERSTEKSSLATQTLKYWIALAGRADIVSDKLRCLLPANVSGHIICDLLDDAKIDARLRERALQLLNIKLLQPSVWQHSDMAAHLPYLTKLAAKLNEWIKPAEEKTAILLCQSAAFSLKLLAKRVLAEEIREIFTETMEKCVSVLKTWSNLDETMVGSLMVLLGELIRSQNLKGILLHIETICKLSADVLAHCEQTVDTNKVYTQLKENEDRYSSTRRRRATQSTTGKQYGEEALMVCALTCMQRLLDHMTQFISTYYGRFMALYIELCVKFEPNVASKTSLIQELPQTSQKYGNIRLRLTQVRQSFTKLEMRTIKEPMMNISKDYIKNPLALTHFVYLLETILKSMELVDIQKSLSALIELYFTLFKFRKYANTEKIEQFNMCDSALVSSFLVLLSNLSERDLKPITGRFVSWIEGAMKPETKTSDRYKLITVFLFANKFYDEYTTLALPHFGKLFDLLPRLLRGLNVIKPDVPNLVLDEPMDTDDSKLILFEGPKGSVQEYHAKQLSDLVLELITKTSKV